MANTQAVVEVSISAVQATLHNFSFHTSMPIKTNTEMFCQTRFVLIYFLKCYWQGVCVVEF